MDKGMIKGFWFLVAGTIVIVAAVLGWIAYKAREVPDDAESRVKYKLNPDVLRLLAYAVVVGLALLTAMYELSVIYAE